MNTWQDIMVPKIVVGKIVRKWKEQWN